MSEISGLGESSNIDRYDAKVETEPKKVEVEAQETATQALPGESEKKLKASEDMHRALAPNLRNLDREQVIKIQLEVAGLPQQFSLRCELLKIKLNAFEAEGYSLQEFGQKLCDARKKNDPSSLLEGPHQELKKEILEIYAGLGLLANTMKRYGDIRYYTTPYLQLFELEQETGFKVTGTEFLKAECEALNEVLKRGSRGLLLGVDLYGAGRVYWDTAFPNILKIFQILEERGEQNFIKKEMESHTLFMFFHPEVYKRLPVVDKSKDPLIQFLPYIVKYFSLEKIEPYFKVRYKDLPECDKAYRWIDLNCQAAEILASIDPNKSLGYLEKAQMERGTKLWAYPFSPNRSVIEEKARQATARIEEARLKCKESDVLKAS